MSAPAAMTTRPVIVAGLNQNLAIESQSSGGYIPGFDGLRALAILLVIIYHVPTGSTPNLVAQLVAHAARLGWVGVDLFFVLSGYLITGILIDERARPRYFRTFFARRVLRIVPVYVAFMLFSMFVSPSIGASNHEAAQQLQGLQVWYWAYLTNVYIALHGFASMAPGTLHLWTLAVEEQFYLLWPIAVLVLSPRSLPRVALACIVGAEACRIAVVSSGWAGQVNYVLLPTRMDTLAVGALLACAARNPSLLATVTRWRRPAIVMSLLALLPPLAIDYTLDGQLHLTQVFAFPALAVFSGVAVLYAAATRGWLTASPLRFIGRYSYGIYIWHGLVIALLARWTTLLYPRTAAGLSLLFYVLSLFVAIAASIAAALVSWYLIERPFVSLKRFVRYA